MEIRILADLESSNFLVLMLKATCIKIVHWLIHIGHLNASNIILYMYGRKMAFEVHSL